MKFNPRVELYEKTIFSDLIIKKKEKLIPLGNPEASKKCDTYKNQYIFSNK